ncbi:MAG: hypothetical protein CL940_10550 [Deltaproteobacteria bacterium]|nr:hypothetical protein [Deltaproteobacteria bacterium]|tara:strand:- start:297 stop:971 length:675 start_codon:yes stop_codon:yes gene_type:complete
MFRSTRTLASFVAFLSLLIAWAPSVSADPAVIVPVPIGDTLRETPLHPVPSKMSFEEYEDMNRNVFQGMLYGGIPGGWHFYAGEERTGWILVGTVAAGIGMIIAGASMAEETGEWADSDFQTTDIGDQRYERVPTGSTRVGDEVTTQFELRPLSKEFEDNGHGALIGLGVATLLGSYVYDFLHGITVIERKRQRVRYKYGQGMNAGVTLDPRTGDPRVSVGLRF